MTAVTFLEEMLTWGGAGMAACVVIRIAVSVTWATYLFARSLISGSTAER